MKNINERRDASTVEIPRSSFMSPGRLAALEQRYQESQAKLEESRETKKILESWRKSKANASDDFQFALIQICLFAVVATGIFVLVLRFIGPF